VQYSIACHHNDEIIWDNNFGKNHSHAHESLKVMILNLHCYQEDNQDYKLAQIAKAIDELNADLVCFQEVAEQWNNGAGDWQTNSARRINELLDAPYHIYTDWSHLGFDIYREGVAILSKYPFIAQESRYVSNDNDPYSIHSRKVVMTQVSVPYIGLLNVFSAHLSWWEDGFKQQFESLSDWARHKHDSQVAGTLLCGDFNVATGSQGYRLVIDGNEYEDQYLSAIMQPAGIQSLLVNDAYWRHQQANDYRIDYIFMNKASELYATSARVLFTDQDYGRVSDHCGYFMTFEPK
jgi:maltose 6'-phosphate phosphatase